MFLHKPNSYLAVFGNEAGCECQLLALLDSLYSHFRAQPTDRRKAVKRAIQQQAARDLPLFDCLIWGSNQLNVTSVEDRQVFVNELFYNGVPMDDNDRERLGDFSPRLQDRHLSYMAWYLGVSRLVWLNHNVSGSGGTAFACVLFF